ncbi:hypothetical protein TNCV_2567581 [Trichonephila clavipes]|uniref:Uncharacterized protein n=1 Tax=Trichonephila clavipes TaxID=2585209 RepID=A0A8X7BLU5_TRICX|nr:hypothetical protein TNCV_2567581 [Trichonephila clavipes]
MTHSGRWIGHVGPPVLCPLRSPDFITVGFFLQWVHFKEPVHQEDVNTETYSAARLNAVSSSVETSLMRRWNSFIPRKYQASFDMHGALFEHQPL